MAEEAGPDFKRWVIFSDKVVLPENFSLARQLESPSLTRKIYRKILMDASRELHVIPRQSRVQPTLLQVSDSPWSDRSEAAIDFLKKNMSDYS
jgi:hypothetical protein